MKQFRRVLWGAVALGAVAAGVIAWRSGMPVQTDTAAEAPAAIGGPFSLVNQNGERATQASYAGKYLLMFFGFTYCPDICPTELAKVTRVMELLPPDVAAQVQPLFISVDPERDTPELLKQYLTMFDPRIAGLTGTPEEIAAVTRAYRIYAAKVPGQGGADYLVDHSAMLYLMRPDGSFATFFRTTDSADVIAAKVAEVAAK
jgi:protein SCO1/2